MPQDVVCRRYQEEEIRQGELLQMVVTLQFPVVAAGGPGDDLILRAVDLGATERLHEAGDRGKADIPIERADLNVRGG
jgi:hypothetical protein